MEKYSKQTLRLFRFILFLFILASLNLSACAPAPASIEPTSTLQPAPTHTALPLEPTNTSTPAPLPLSEPGPYATGYRSVTLTDPSRPNRLLLLTAWYPALPESVAASEMGHNAEVDASGGPYPLILTYTGLGEVIAPLMASYGFVIIGFNNQFPSDQWGTWLVDYPLDYLFVLNQLADNPPEALAGMFDANNTGIMGYSFSGYNALALSGAQADPAYYLDQCSTAEQRVPPLEEWWIQYICTPAQDWQTFEDHALGLLVVGEDGLWQPLTDPRIRAVMPMAPEGAWLFGERGLAAVNLPTLILDGTEDRDCPYREEAVYIFEHLDPVNTALISFLGQDHYMVFEPNIAAQISHFAVAFFGLHLQGQTDYAVYLTEAYVNAIPGLEWGVVE